MRGRILFALAVIRNLLWDLWNKSKNFRVPPSPDHELNTKPPGYLVQFLFTRLRRFGIIYFKLKISLILLFFVSVQYNISILDWIKSRCCHLKCWFLPSQIPSTQVSDFSKYVSGGIFRHWTKSENIIS
jgi:hypothetical protein